MRNVYNALNYKYISMKKAGTEKHRQHMFCQHFSVPAS